MIQEQIGAYCGALVKLISKSYWKSKHGVMVRSLEIDIDNPLNMHSPRVVQNQPREKLVKQRQTLKLGWGLQISMSGTPHIQKILSPPRAIGTFVEGYKSPCR